MLLIVPMPIYAMPYQFDFSCDKQKHCYPNRYRMDGAGCRSSGTGIIIDAQVPDGQPGVVAMYHTKKVYALLCTRECVYTSFTHPQHTCCVFSNLIVSQLLCCMSS